MMNSKKKIVRVLSLLAFTLLIVIGCTTAAFAETEASEAAPDTAAIVKSGTCGPNLTYTLDENGVLIISGSGAMDDYDAYRDSKPAPPWYRDAYDVKKVVIEEGVTSIGSDAFCDCKEMVEVHIPSTITQIKSGSFYNCKKIKEVHISDISNFINAADSFYIDNTFKKLFVDGKSAEELIIPDGIESLPGTFEGFSNIKKVVIPSSVKSLGEHAFRECHALEEVTINGNPYSWWGPFAGCPIKKITAPNLTTKDISNLFGSIHLSTVNRTTTSATIVWPNYPNIEKIEVLNVWGEKIATLDGSKTSYTVKGKDKNHSKYTIVFYYDDGKSPGLQSFTEGIESVDYKPYKGKITKLSTGSKYIKVFYKKANVDGYQVQIATNSKFTAGKKTYTITDWDQISKKISKLKKNKKYYVRVRTFNEENIGFDLYNGRTTAVRIYGSWSDTESIKCK